VDRFSLKNKIALITAGSGDLFGSSVTEALAEAGATVLTASRSLERNEEYAASMRARGFQARGYQLDIASVKSIAALRQQIIADFGRVDILVNNALTRDGHGRDTSAGDVTATAENAARVAAGDFVGLFELCNQFIPEMQRNGGGSIINSAPCPNQLCTHRISYRKHISYAIARIGVSLIAFVVRSCSIEHIRRRHPGPADVRRHALFREAEPHVCVAGNAASCARVF
jgi:NADP-dependent 3-hydroxy acid dehydrogenase YdfG